MQACYLLPPTRKLMEQKKKMCDTCICLFLCLTCPDINVWSQPCAHCVVLQGAQTQFGFMPVAPFFFFSNIRFWQLQYGSRPRRQVEAWLLRRVTSPPEIFMIFFPLRIEAKAKIITQTRAQKPLTCQNTMCFAAFALGTNSQGCTSVKINMCCQVMQVCFHLEPRDQVRMTGPRDDILSSFADLSSLCFGLLSGGGWWHAGRHVMLTLKLQSSGVLTGVTYFPHAADRIKVDL